MAKLERIKPGALEKEPLSYKRLDDRDIFWISFVIVSGQTWGGKTDIEVEKLAKLFLEYNTDYKKILDKYRKHYGKVTNQGYSVEGIDPDDLKDFYEATEELGDTVIALPADFKKIQLIKRKKNSLSAIHAAALSDIFEVVWPGDDGSDLDKEK